MIKMLPPKKEYVPAQPLVLLPSSAATFFFVYIKASGTIQDSEAII